MPDTKGTSIPGKHRSKSIGFPSLPLRLTALGLLTGCILHGPWDYVPEDPGNYRGMWVTGYVVAEQPVRDLCIEKLLALDEEYTDAFPFYKNAEVNVTGVFDGVEQTITMVPDSPPRVNCFTDPQVRLPGRGETYELAARIEWDSAGRSVVSNISATARVPEFFSVRDTARAPAVARTGIGLDTSSDQLSSLASLFQYLPEEGQREFGERYGDTLATLLSQGDTAAMMAYYTAEQDNITALLNKYTVEFYNGDSLYYLTGEFFLLSYLFGSSRSDDVVGVQITHGFGSATADFNAGLGPILGTFERDSASYYFEGERRHFMYYSQASGSDGFSLLDSMAILNPMLFGGLNVFYFYGFERAYLEWYRSAVENGDDPRAKPVYSVTGAAGIFAGAVADSFSIFIKADGQTEVFPREVTHVLDCKDDGWYDSKDCRAFYPAYCDSIQWRDRDCLTDLFTTALELGVNLNFFLDSMGVLDSGEVGEKEIVKAKDQGKLNFCVSHNFPDSVRACAGYRNECASNNGINDCKELMWLYCLDRQWIPEQCGLGLVSYCTDRPRKSEILCSNADAYCAGHPEEALCND